MFAKTFYSMSQHGFLQSANVLSAFPNCKFDTNMLNMSSMLIMNNTNPFPRGVSTLQH